MAESTGQSPAPAGPSASAEAQRNAAFVRCLGTGALGIASGFAVFFLLLEEAEKPLKFLLILLLATVLSVIVEHLREVIENRHGAEHSGSVWRLSAAV